MLVIATFKRLLYIKYAESRNNFEKNMLTSDSQNNSRIFGDNI